MFSEIAKTIIDDVIKKVICIDDEFVEPYSESEGGALGYELAKELYSSLSEQEKIVKIVKYNSKDLAFLDTIEKYDLAILDWHLTKSDPYYSDTLRILERIVEEDIRFVAIYTNEQLDGVISQIAGYFNMVDEESLKLLKELTADLRECLEEEHSALFSEIKKVYYDDSNWDVLTKDLNNVNGEIVKCIKEINKSEFSERINRKGLIELIGVLESSTDFIKKSDLEKRIKISPKYKDVFKIKNTIVTLMNKKTAAHDSEKNKLKPSEIVDKLTEYAMNAPNYYMSLVWCELTSILGQKTKKIMSGYSTLNEDTFLHFLNKNDNSKISINELILDETSYLIHNDFILKSIENKDKWLQNKVGNDREANKLPESKDIYQFNHLRTQNYCKLNYENRQLLFGDILRYRVPADDSYVYFLCITPHCDCALPKDKIKNNYIFVKGKKTTKEGTYTEPEKFSYSFIKEDSDYFAIDWDHKFQIIKIENPIQNGKVYGKNLDYGEMELDFISNQKENFTQRVANETGAHFTRVGISLLNI